MKYGTEEGEACGRDGCEGVMHLPEPEDCSCHISPPCSACVDREIICQDCGENWVEDVEIPQKVTSFLPDWMR